ncbi:hypothetical protein CspeluHIS016_0300100 [Cutaneotrichosporon spelunceum]|uniref:Uncharacterized protein n=1 Tax=Cutaneotrichosporon spelunceum TaxID=1672016 RepID=A0AAD3TTI7_9TREE|nr:hypothetical protein CspeluHIS016_0300100 [Cutaneotrichosporon spelunceum]
MTNPMPMSLVRPVPAIKIVTPHGASYTFNRAQLNKAAPRLAAQGDIVHLRDVRIENWSVLDPFNNLFLLKWEATYALDALLQRAIFGVWAGEVAPELAFGLAAAAGRRDRARDVLDTKSLCNPLPGWWKNRVPEAYKIAYEHAYISTAHLAEQIEVIGDAFEKAFK